MFSSVRGTPLHEGQLPEGHTAPSFVVDRKAFCLVALPSDAGQYKTWAVAMESARPPRPVDFFEWLFLPSPIFTEDIALRGLGNLKLSKKCAPLR